MCPIALATQQRKIGVANVLGDSGNSRLVLWSNGDNHGRELGGPQAAPNHDASRLLLWHCESSGVDAANAINTDDARNAIQMMYDTRAIERNECDANTESVIMYHASRQLGMADHL